MKNATIILFVFALTGTAWGQTTRPATNKTVLTGIRAAVGKIPPRLLSKKIDAETELDAELRDKWVKENLPGYTISISKARVSSVSSAEKKGEGFVVLVDGEESVGVHCVFTIAVELPVEAGPKLATVNLRDEVSLLGKIGTIKIRRQNMPIPDSDRERPGFLVILDLAEAKITGVTHNQKRGEEQ